MRSRYVAYTRSDRDYLLATWHAATRPADVEFTGPAVKWLGLQVQRHEQADACHAIVEFVARYKVQGRAYRLHEISRFLRVEGHWRYVDGDIID